MNDLCEEKEKGSVIFLTTKMMNTLKFKENVYSKIVIKHTINIRGQLITDVECFPPTNFPCQTTSTTRQNTSYNRSSVAGGENASGN